MMSLLTELGISTKRKTTNMPRLRRFGLFLAAGAKLFKAVAFFDLGVGEARCACVAHAGFGQIEIIVQILQFLAQRGCVAFSFHNFDFAPGKGFVQKKSHRLLQTAIGEAHAPRVQSTTPRR